jgi:RNA polymerase sigma-70 factor (ECF subfamily)
MTSPADFKSDLLAAIPALRAFAVSLSGKSGWADDMVQETLVKAWANQSSFEPGSRMQAWLFTILRHEFYSEYRRRRHEVPDPDGTIAARLTTHPSQDGHIAFREFQIALSQLAPGYREALILVGASGLSYDEAAGIANCAVGTMKSRVARARGKLAQLLVSDEDHLAPIVDARRVPDPLRVPDPAPGD